MTIEKNAYQGDDLPLLQSALAGWIAEAGDCGYCHVGDVAHRLNNDLHSLPLSKRVTVWHRALDQIIVGFAINLVFDNAFEVYVSPAFRGTSEEKLMLETAQNDTWVLIQEAGTKEKTVMMDVWACDSVRKSQMQALGFRQYRAWTFLTERSLINKAIPEKPLPDGFTIRRAKVDDIAQLAIVQNSAFGDDISPEDFQNTVIQAAGFDIQDEMVVVAPDGRIAAYTHLWFDYQNGVGMFEPVGAHQDFHRMGLTSAMMAQALREMHKAGMHTAQVSYTVTNVAAERLYRRLGFVIKDWSVGMIKAIT